MPQVSQEIPKQLHLGSVPLPSYSLSKACDAFCSAIRTLLFSGVRDTGKDYFKKSEISYLLCSLSQVLILIVGMVGQGPSSAQFDSCQQLHAPSKHCCAWSV